MRFNDTVYLINRSTGTNVAGYRNVQDIEVEVYADVSSVKRSEFFSGLSAGIALSKTIKVRALDYEGQEFLRHEDKFYKVIRSYTKDGELCELSCQEVMRSAIGT